MPPVTTMVGENNYVDLDKYDTGPNGYNVRVMIDLAENIVYYHY